MPRMVMLIASLPQVTGLGARRPPAWPAARPSWASRVRRHREGEHLGGVDPRVHRARVQEALPLRAVAGHVDLQQGPPEAGVPLAGDVDRDGAPVNRDGELLTRQMSGADLGPHADVPEAE